MPSKLEDSPTILNQWQNLNSLACRLFGAGLVKVLPFFRLSYAGVFRIYVGGCQTPGILNYHRGTVNQKQVFDSAQGTTREWARYRSPQSIQLPPFFLGGGGGRYGACLEQVDLLEE